MTDLSSLPGEFEASEDLIQARNWDGKVIRWGVRRISQTLSPMAAEMFAVKEGICLGRRLKLGRLDVDFNFWRRSPRPVSRGFKSFGCT